VGRLDHPETAAIPVFRDRLDSPEHEESQDTPVSAESPVHAVARDRKDKTATLADPDRADHQEHPDQ